MKYVKKPIPVDAFLWHGQIDAPGLPPGAIHSVRETLPDGPVVGKLNSLEAVLDIRSGEHYVVGPGAKGEFWAVEKEIFEATYEPA